MTLTNDDMKFKEFELREDVQKAIARQGYSNPTLIQEKAIPVQIQGKDLFGVAQTGTGKTAAFCLPLINKLSADNNKALPKHTRSLILAPTRELAAQIHDSVITYSYKTNISCAVVYGGVGQNNQVKQMLSGVDVLIATPGRLLDLINQGHIKLDSVEVLVLDEADRMLDMGFAPDIKKIISKIPSKRQSVFFSATMPSSIKKFANSILNNPEYIIVEQENIAADTVEQHLIFIPQRQKSDLLLHLLSKNHLECVLVFTRTKRKADKVARELKKAGIKADSIHSDKSQNKRMRALESFHNGRIRVLIATDIAARGIDVNDISHVINYDLPDDAENYVHRIGRTGRAKQKGVSYSFCASDERRKLKAVEKVLGSKIPVLVIDDFRIKKAADASDGALRNNKKSSPKQYGARRRKRRQKY